MKSFSIDVQWVRFTWLAGLIAIGLAGCSSGGGGAVPKPAPAPPPVSAPPPGSPPAISLKMTITSVSINDSHAPVVNFSVANETGARFPGLQAASLRFDIAKLSPGVNGNPSAWQNYINATDANTTNSNVDVTGDVEMPALVTQDGTADASKPGALVDHGDGTYTYTFVIDLTDASKTCPSPCVGAGGNPLDTSYQPSFTHRVGAYVRPPLPLVNATFDFRPDGSTVTLERDIVSTAKCDQCHEQLNSIAKMAMGEHGGRIDTKLCVTCHNPGSWEGVTGNTVDFKVMIHKIHRGKSLPSVVAGGTYGIGDSDFSSIVFPQEIRNCTKCHDGTAGAPNTAAQGDHWKTDPSIEACGSCHDNVNFQTGANHSAANLGNLTNADCATCHGPNATISNGTLKVDVAHQIPERAFQKKFAYNFISVTNTGPGQTPVIRFSVTDPTNNNKPWDLLADEPFTQCAGDTASDLMLMIAWNTLDHIGDEFDIPAACMAPLPTANGDGTFTVTSPQMIPPDATGSACALIQGHPSHDFNDGRGVQVIPVPNALTFMSITDPTPVPRRTVVDLKKCDACHDQLNPLAHGGDRVETTDGCTFCHFPQATDRATRVELGIVTAADAVANAPDQLQEQAIDFKILIHAVHFGPNRGLAQNAPYVVYHNGTVNNFTTLTPFPGTVSNCLACHAAGTFYPPDPSKPTPLASTIRTVDATGAPLANQVAITAGAAVCSSCHATAIAKTHMTQNGANFAAVKDQNDLVVSGETCLVCHGLGALEDVQVVHRLASFQ